MTQPCAASLQRSGAERGALLEKKYLLLAPLLAAIYWDAGRELYRTWTMVDSYYSHGFLVPFVSLWVLWYERRRLLAAARRPSSLGYLVISFAALLLIAGDFLSFRVLTQASLVIMLTGLWLLFQGMERLRIAWFAFAFLFFMVPIPASMTQSVTLELKLLATRGAVELCKLFTLPMVQEGSYIYFGNDSLLVGEVCGGLRSLIALLALGALVAYFSKTKLWARVAIFIFSGPIAIIANMLRIFFLCVVGYFWGSEVAGGTVHDVSGYLIYAVAFLLLFALDALLKRIAPAKAAAPEGTPQDPQGEEPAGAPAPRPWRAWRHFAVAVAVLAALTAWHVSIAQAQRRAGLARPAAEVLQIPTQIASYRQVGVDAEIDDRTKRVLETSNILIRSYRSGNGRPVQLTIVYAGATRRSLHFPELCLVGVGWEIRERRTASVGLLFEAQELVLVKNDQREAVMYWFKTGDALTGNYFVNAYYWAVNQIRFGNPTSAMIKLTAPIGNDGEEAAFATLRDFAAKFVPVLREAVP